MKNIIFENEQHKKRYISLLHEVGETEDTGDTEIKSAMYLLALIGKNEKELFDFSSRSIIPKGIKAAWQTGGTVRATRLLYILWNGFPSERQQKNNNIYNIFGYSEWDKYFIEAIKIRYPYTTTAKGE